MLDPRLNHMVAVSRLGSFTSAAAAIGVTQSAVTKSVADLEKQIGYPIFYRTGRGAILTEKGRDFCDRASRLLEDATDLFANPSGKADAYAGVLRIGVGPASLEWLLAKPAARLLKKQPSIRFDINGGSFERMVQLLRNGSVDVAIGFESEFREFSDLRREPVGVLTTRLFVRRGHPLLARNPVTTEDLAEFEFISPSDSRPHGMVIRNLAQLRPSGTHEHIHTIDYFPIARELVATSNAVGVVAMPFARSRSFQSEFEVIESIHPFNLEPVCCAMRVRWEAKPAARAFIGIMRQLWPA